MPPARGCILVRLSFPCKTQKREEPRWALSFGHYWGSTKSTHVCCFIRHEKTSHPNTICINRNCPDESAFFQRHELTHRCVPRAISQSRFELSGISRISKSMSC